ncbi:hypothetical protein JXA32_17855 [Candidatus Sumerlaeota bacterium]|nr:hypothetical protein [Candidatus Sumerlaeota bacterium]
MKDFDKSTAMQMEYVPVCPVIKDKGEQNKDKPKEQPFGDEFSKAGSVELAG